MRRDISSLLIYSLFLRFKIAFKMMATALAMTIPFEKNICSSVGKVLKRLLPFNPTPAEIDTAAMRKLCSLCSKSTRAPRFASLERHKTEHDEHCSTKNRARNNLVFKAPNLV